MDSNLDSMFIESELIVPVSIEFRDDLSPEDFGQLCRLCGNSNPQLMPIFSDDGDEHKLSDKIKEHLPIIEISRNDILPLSICYQCASTLISWHELYYACKDADLRLKQICSRLKLEKFESEENLMEIHDDVDYADDIDSYEPVEELPNESCMSPKPEVILPHPVSAETTPEKSDSFKDVAFVESSNPIEESMAVDNEVRKPSVEEIGKPSVEEMRKPPDEIKIRYPPISRKETKWISGLSLVRLEKPFIPLVKKCVICHGDVEPSAANDVLCPSCLRKDPMLLQLPKHENAVAPTTSLRKYLAGTAQRGPYLQCDKCDFQCAPLSKVFYAHHSVHAAKPKPKEGQSRPTVAPEPTRRNAYECDHCHKRFGAKGTLARHLRRHEKSAHACAKCSATFRTIAQLRTHRRRHMRVANNSTLIFCDQCNKYFKSKKGFAYHQRNICVRFKCYICDVTFEDEAAMMAHSDEKHSREPKAVDEAATVAQVAEGVAQPALTSQGVAQPALTTQGTAHTSQDVAQSTAQEAAQEELVRQAVVEVSAQSRVSAKSRCTVCGKEVTATVMSRHMLLHTKEHPFTCAQCGKRFKRKSSLQDHIMIEMGWKNYVCDICGVKFLKQGYLNKHMRYHKLSNGEFQGFECEICGKRFSEKWRLGVHQRSVHKGGRFASCKCDICGQLFAERYMVRVHKHQEHNGEELREFQCAICERKFLEQWMLKSHLRNTHRSGQRKMYCDLCGRSDHQAQDCAHRHVLQLVPCMVCGETFPSKSALREHVVSKHDCQDQEGDPSPDEEQEAPEPDTKKKVFHVCAGCGKHYVSKQHLRAHEQQDNCFKVARYECALCGKTFNSKFSLGNHRMLHKKEHTELPYRCEFCAKEFAAEESLQSHLGLEKVCLLCDAVYPCNDLLKSHVFGVHNQDEPDGRELSSQLAKLKQEAGVQGTMSYKCKLCGKKFLRKQAMKNHLFAEMNLRRYVCEFCDKSYNYYSHLKEHLVAAHGENEFLCGYCGKDFPTKKRFRDHVSLHSDEKPFTCDCGHSFKLSRYLSKHKKNCKLSQYTVIEEETVELVEAK